MKGGGGVWKITVVVLSIYHIQAESREQGGSKIVFVATKSNKVILSKVFSFIQSHINTIS